MAQNIAYVTLLYQIINCILFTTITNIWLL